VMHGDCRVNKIAAEGAEASEDSVSSAPASRE
jgi:hypothetical protein